MTNTLAVEVRDLRKDYGGFTAVAGTSFEVSHGQVLALLGTNGAGKTTTMDVLGGFQAPTSGSVRVLGEDPFKDRKKIASRVGIMLQDAGFFESLTVEDTIDAWRRFTPGARSRAESLEMVGLTDQAHTGVGRLSGGEKRRLDLALSLLGTPEVLFLDEPTTGLDPEARRNTWNLLRELTREGLTVLLTTHYMEEAEFLADEVVIMDHGKIVQQGSLVDMVARSAATVTFRLPQEAASDDLPNFPDVQAVNDCGRVRLTTHNPQQTLLRLLTWSQERNLELIDMQVDSGSLEETFLEIAAEGKVAR